MRPAPGHVSRRFPNGSSIIWAYAETSWFDRAVNTTATQTKDDASGVEIEVSVLAPNGRWQRARRRAQQRQRSTFHSVGSAAAGQPGSGIHCDQSAS